MDVFSTKKSAVEYTIQELISMGLDTYTISTDSTLGEVASVYTYVYGPYNMVHIYGVYYRLYVWCI